MPPLPLKVLVSGGGIAGNCLAYWLAKTPHAISITVLERAPKPRTTGQAVDVRGNAVEVIKRMQLEETLRRKHTSEIGTQFLGPDGKAVATFVGFEGFTAEFEVLRADLANLLQAAAANEKAVEHRYNDSIVSLEQTKDKVKVRFKNGGSESYDMMVAADGSTSSTRPLVLNEETLKGSYRPLGQYLAFFSIPRTDNDDKLWKWYSVPEGKAMMLRPHRKPDDDAPETVGVYFALTLPRRDQTHPDIEQAMTQGNDEIKRVLYSHFKDAGWQSDRFLTQMKNSSDFYFAKAGVVRLPKWSNGRAILLGDAAMATFGIGTTLAIQGGYILAGEIAKIQSGADIPEALVRYEKLFRSVYGLESSDRAARFFPQAFCPQTSWGLWLRNTLLWLIAKSQVLRLSAGRDNLSWKLPEYPWKV